MSNKDHYFRWLQIKKKIWEVINDDGRIQQFAKSFTGIKPQSTAVEIVARVYIKYCDIYNKLCECYDQMEQVQRRPYIKKIIDAVTCRLMELKSILENVEAFEFTYPENALQQLLMIPDEIQIMCPFHYPFEIRQQEMQFIIDEIMAGNRLGDPTPTPSQTERFEKQKLEEERLKQEEKEAEIKRKLVMGEDIEESVASVVLSPEELAELKYHEENNFHISSIQRMERSRVIIRQNARKAYKDLNMYLELTGLKASPQKEFISEKASTLIKSVLKIYMDIKREHIKDFKLREKLGMIIPSYSSPSAKIQLESIKEKRRSFRRQYYEKWLQDNLEEKSRILRVRRGDIMEDISDEIRQWFQEWYTEVRVFDEYPWPEEQGTILVVRGETFTIPEYIEWQEAEQKRLKAEAGSPKSKEEIKAQKRAAKEEKKQRARETQEREKKRLLNYKKQRLKSENDPGVYYNIGAHFDAVKEAWETYESQWRDIDIADAPNEALKGHIKQLVIENMFQEVHFELRPIVDDLMRIELNMLKSALKVDYLAAGISKPPQSKKRKKPKIKKPPKPDKVSPAVIFQQLVDNEIIRKYPSTTLNDYWGEQNFAAADLRAIPWTPSFPPTCIGDAREQIRLKCILTLGSSCSNATRTQLLVGPKSSGKRTLVYAIATETNSILIDLSPMNVYNKFPGKGLKTMFQYINKICRLMQPAIIFVDNVEKLCYKKVPPEEKQCDPTRLQKYFFKEIVKPITINDKILILGTATEPWLAKTKIMYKIFPNVIMLPRTDYGSISYTLTKLLMQYHGVDRDIDVHSVAQALRGYDMHSIISSLSTYMSGERIAQLYHKPLQPIEIVNAVLSHNGGTYTGRDDYDAFNEWYLVYSPWGEKYTDYMIMLESQLKYKLKSEKKGF